MAKRLEFEFCYIFYQAKLDITYFQYYAIPSGIYWYCYNN